MRITIFCGASTGENPVYSEKQLPWHNGWHKTNMLWCMVEEKLA